MPTNENLCADLLTLIGAEWIKLRDNEIARWGAKEDCNPKFGLSDVLRGMNRLKERAYVGAARTLEMRGIIALDGHASHSSETVSNPFWKRRGGQGWRVRHTEDMTLTVRVLKPGLVGLLGSVQKKRLTLAARWSRRHTALLVVLADADGKIIGGLDAALGKAKKFEGSYDGIPDKDVIEERDQPVGFVSSMSVERGSWGDGLGRILMTLAVEELAQAGAVAIYLQSSDADGTYPDPTGFYEKMGYEKIGEDSAGQPYMRRACL